mmetsp:Transcript_3528/g.8491  ORF Transcript_3528/g.8491 Transcript_3528/m.8491 type:complete len:204 (+) Transcript_3528:862-1473(+)
MADAGQFRQAPVVEAVPGAAGRTEQPPGPVRPGLARQLLENLRRGGDGPGHPRHRIAQRLRAHCGDYQRGIPADLQVLHVRPIPAAKAGPGLRGRRRIRKKPRKGRQAPGLCRQVRGVRHQGVGGAVPGQADRKDEGPGTLGSAHRQCGVGNRALQTAVESASSAATAGGCRLREQRKRRWGRRDFAVPPQRCVRRIHQHQQR